MTQEHLITLLRHGQSVDNAAGIIQGQRDYPLSPDGEEQARRLAHRWQAEGECFDFIIASPLQRALQTAQIIAENIPAPLETDPDWMEIDLGEMSGMTGAEAERRFPHTDNHSPYSPSGRTGESWWEVYLRSAGALQRLLRRPPARYLIVSHGGILKSAMYAILGIPPQPRFIGPHFPFPNAGFARVSYNPAWQAWALLQINDNRHVHD
ncbi:MAG: histidine phosphatase family protein [Chloroflexi bacterium]|nr:histidine phosphatase family protein [Chloroflexota bacterium]